VTYGVRVEDDGTRVIGNTFAGPDATHHAIVVGTRFRTDALDHPVRDTTVTGNVSSIVGNAFPYRWNHGIDGLTSSDNTALGRSAGLCRGTALPHTDLIFVLYAAVDDPENPPEPPPGLAAPTVGVVPSCGFVTPGAVVRTEANAGSATVQVPVTLSKASAEPVTAEWSTIPVIADGFASAPADYVAASGSVSFAPGQTSRTVPVTIKGDAADEPDEFVLLGFSDPTNAVVGGLGGLGIVVVTDDDPLPSVHPGVASVTEADSGTVTLEIPVTLSAPSGRVVTAAWATAAVSGPAFASSSSDFDPASGTVTFAPGQTVRTVEVTVHGDLVDEPDELVVTGFSAPTNATLGGFGLGIGVIADDDPS
jgi:hypothetical protein